MSDRIYRRLINKLRTPKPVPQTQPLALHSMLLALEPRMVFDASLVAGAEALHHEAPDQAPPSPQSEPADQQPADQQSADQHMDIAPASGGWNADPEVDFTNGSFTVDEDTLLTIGADGIKLNDSDSDNFRITIKVDHGVLSLDYIAGVVGNQYTFNADRSQVTFEADKETTQKVLDTLKYQANKDYNGTDTLNISIEDGENGWAKSDFSQEITINPVADKPFFKDASTLPGSTLVDEDTQSGLTFNHGTKDAPVWKPLQIDDADGTGGLYDLELRIKNGTLSAAGLGAGTLEGDALVYRLSGQSLDAINALLANLQFQGNKDFYGKAELGLSITDNDPALASDPLVKTFDIDVLAVNDNPVLNPADAADRAHQLTVAETNDSSSGKSAEGLLDLTFFNIDYDGSAPDANGTIPLFDVDNNLDQLMVRVDALPEHGTLWKKIGGSWIKMAVGSTFSLMDVYNNNVKYVHDSGHQVSEGLTSGSTQDHFSYTLVDGAGGSGSAVLYINLQPVNQGPSLVTDGPVVEAYEGQQGIPFSFKVVDPDQALGADYTVHFTQLPDPLYGVFWYSADGGATYQKVTTATEISLEAVQSGFLRFNHSGKENAIGSFSFTLAVSDDGGGEGSPQEIECTLSMSVLPNNDHPEWDSSVKSLWADNQHTVTVDGARIIPITSAFLNARDNDSSKDNITYTVTYGSSGDSGRLLYNTGRVDGDGKPIYRIIASGEKVSQSDIDSGKVNWWFDGTGNKTADLQFIVRDGSITAMPVPNDADQPLIYPVPGGSASGWEHGAGPHEGAIGTWQETSPGSGVYAWVPTVHTLTLVSTNIIPGEVPSNPEVIDPIPNFNSSQNTATVSEGNDVQLTDAMLNAWFTNKADGNAVIDPSDPSGSPDKLVYRIEEMTKSGQLVISHDGGATFTILGLYSSFTQKDIQDGKVYYRHGGSETFSDSFKFSLSDGRNEAQNVGDGTTIFALNFDVTPLNDTPSAGKGADVKVNEHDTANAKSDTLGGVVTITTANIAIADVDGTGDKRGQGYATPNDLYIIITGLPEHGTLYLNGVAITALTDAAKLAAIKAGGGYASWGADPNMAGITIISLADIAAGKLTYRHDGSENFSDTFSYLVSDNQNIDQVSAADHNGGSVNGAEQAVSIAVTPVNDRPELAAPATPLQLDEGGTATITSANIHVVDPDGTASAIQFIVTEIPKYGELTLNGKVLGVDSVFTQKDIDEGRIQYTHKGSENHSDSFSYKLSDSIYMASNGEASTFTFEITPVNDAPLIETPDTIYVESIAGGVIINGIKITDPDYGPNNQLDASDTGVTNDLMTVDLKLIDPPGGVTLDLAQIDLFFGNGSGGFISPGVRNGDTYTLVGTFAQIQTWLSQVKIQSKTTSGTTYDPNGDIHLDITVHDGVFDTGTSSWKNANGSGGADVYSANDLVKVFISPINNAPDIETGSPTSLATTEDGGAVPVTDNGGNPITITDVDVFERGGNSITLSVEHGILLVTPISGPTIEGRGTANLTITGTLAQINQVLASLQYKADANYNGADKISYIFKDNANSGELPNTISTTTYANHGDQFKYDTGRTDASSNVIWGLAVYGVVNITITPVNDAPVIQAPKEVFINDPLIFGGNDNMGKPTSIVLSDIDITGPGTFKNDTLTVTLSVDNTNGGKLILADSDRVGSVQITGGASDSNTITLTGTLADLNATLAKLGYDQANWDAGTPSKLTITVSDVANGNQSNGSDGAGSALIASHEILINCSNNNDGPSVTLPGGNWSATEDAAATKIFNGAGTITLDDPDTFDGQVFVSVSVGNGVLSVTKADLAAAGFVFSGDPALQDAFKISADGKTITFKASLDKINAALKQITYKTSLNFNGEDSVRVYINDCGLWGATTGSEQDVPANELGMTGKGLVAEQTGTITVQAVNDAPTASGSSKDFWNGSGSTQADLEDTTGTNASAKTVNDLFASMFQDAADNQKSLANTTGSEANSFAGVVIVGNTATAAQGTWQYSIDNGANWTNISGVSAANGLYLDTNAQLRFVPKADFNGTPGALAVRLADNSTDAITSGTGGVDTSGSNSGGATRYSSDTIALSNYVRAVNDAPAITYTGGGQSSGTPITVNEDTSLSFNGGNRIILGDIDVNETVGGKLSLTLSVGHGTLTLTTTTGVTGYSGAAGSLILTGSLADLNNALATLSYKGVLDYNGTDTLSITVNDQGNTGAGGTLSDSRSIYMSVSAVNDAPVIVSGKETITQTTPEDTEWSGGAIAALFGNSFSDAKDQVSGGSSSNTLAGVFITSLDQGAGEWYYQVDGSGSWIKIDPLNAGAAFYLKASDTLKLVPNSNYNSATPTTLTAKLHESGGVTTYSTGVTTVPAYTADSQISQNAVSLNVTVAVVNDAPVADTSDVTLSIAEDVANGSNPGQSLSDLFGARFSDAKDNRTANNGSSANTFDGVAIVDYTADSTKGQWQYYDGSAWHTLPNCQSDNAFILLDPTTTKLRFVPVADFNGPTPELKVALLEGGNSFTRGQSVDLTGIGTTGGSSHISAETVALKLTVTAVNDAPSWNSDVFSPIEGPGDSNFIYNGEMHLNRSNAANAANFSPAKSVAELFGAAFNDSRDGVGGGSAANSLHGVWITGINGATSLGNWQYSTDGGSSWTTISGVSPNNALFLDSTAQVRFAANIATNLPIGTPPHTGLSVALSDSSATTPATGDRADISGSARGGTSAISADSIPLWMTIHQMNYAPEINNLAPITVTERTPALLAPAITVSDSDLDHPSNASKWSGASITLSRQGGANADDVFSAGPGLQALTEGGALVINGTTIGTVTRNSGGMLVLTFNSQADKALISSALQAVCYTNASHNPSGSVTLQWLVDDGNYEKDGLFPQGDNPSGETSGKALATQVVSLTTINDAPIANDDAAKISSESTQPLYGSVLDNDFDYEGPVSVSDSEAHLARYGTLSINRDGSYSYVLNPQHPALAALKPGESLVESIRYTIVDAEGLTATAILRISIDKPLPPPVFVDNGEQENDEKRDVSPLLPSLPSTGSEFGLAADKPVVREALLFQDALDRSVNNSLLVLGQSLRSMEDSLERSKIILSGHMADQTVYSGLDQKLSLPDNLFRHSLPGEHLSYSVSLEDGSPLPDWLHWDSRSLSFYANPEQAGDEPLTIKIVATDRFNNKAVSIFRIDVAAPPKAKPILLEEQPYQKEGAPSDEHKTGKPVDGTQQEHTPLEKTMEPVDEAPPTSEPVAEEKHSGLSLPPGALDISGQIALHGHNGLVYKAQASLSNLIGHSA